MLNIQLRKQKALYQPIYRLAETAEKVNISQIDLAALENMPLNQLQQLVQDLQRDLHKNFHFISDQEEKLRLQQQTINELQAQLSQTNEDNRINLETELAEEQDRYRMLNETLVGQHQNLRERQQFMSQHQAVLWRRQGIDPEIEKKTIKLISNQLFKLKRSGNNRRRNCKRTGDFADGRSHSASAGGARPSGS